MTEKICDFCGEPLADWAQEHDLADCAHYLKDKVAQLEAEKYCYDDELPCKLTDELFAASIVDGVRLYPWRAVAKQLKAENEWLIEKVGRMRARLEEAHTPTPRSEGYSSIGSYSDDEALGGE